jgi:hypothetical protein
MKRLTLIEFAQLESKNKGKSILDDLPFNFCAFSDTCTKQGFVSDCASYHRLLKAIFL